MAKKLIIVRKKKSTYGILNIGKFSLGPPSCSWKKTITTTMRVKGLNGLDEGRRVKSSKKAIGPFFYVTGSSLFVGLWSDFEFNSEFYPKRIRVHKLHIVS